MIELDEEDRMFSKAVRSALIRKRDALIVEVAREERLEREAIAFAVANHEPVDKSWEARWRATERLRAVNRLLEVF